MKKTLLALLMVVTMLLGAGSGFAANDLIGGDGGVEHWVHINSISVSPSNTSVAEGSQASFTATAHYSDGSSKDVTSQCSWSSSDPSVLSGDGPSFTGASPGTAEVSAMCWEPGSGTATGEAMVQVHRTTPPVGHVTMSISPGSYTLKIGQQVQFRATLNRTGTRDPYSDVSSSAVWSIDDSIATLSGSGSFVATNAGTSTVRVNFYDSITGQNFSDAAELTVLPPVKPTATLSISPASQSGYVDDVRKYSAYLRFSDGSSRDVTNSASWRSADPSIAYSMGNGRFEAKDSGNGTIVAVVDYSGQTYSDSADFHVYNNDGLYLTPATATISAGSSVHFKAFLRHKDGRADEDITRLCNWSVDNSGATVAGKGEIRGTAKCQTNVYAVYKGSTTLSASAGLTVNDSVQPDSHRVIAFQVGSNQYTVDGAIRSMEVSPFVSDGRTYVPQGYLGYAMGLDEKDITWDSASQSVTFQKNGTTLVMTLGSVSYFVNGMPRTMDVPPVIKNNRVFCPVFYVANAFGYQVSFDAISRSVTVSR
ncbi:MAG: stalk domain-containing protein [Syntrophomonas sp.]